MTTTIPATMIGDRGSVLKAELETYSEQTLDLLYQDLSKLKAEGKNGSEEVYRYLVKEGMA